MSYFEMHGKPGVGILVLQHENYDKGERPFSLHLRACKMATRLKERRDKSGALGHWKEDRDATGDLTNALNWPNDKQGPRPISGWAWAWAARVSNGPSGTATGTVTPTAGATFTDPLPPVASGGGIGPMVMRKSKPPNGRISAKAGDIYPIANGSYAPDKRFLPFVARGPQIQVKGNPFGADPGEDGPNGPGQPGGNPGTLILGIGGQVWPLSGGGGAFVGPGGSVPIFGGGGNLSGLTGLSGVGFGTGGAFVGSGGSVPIFGSPATSNIGFTQPPTTEQGGGGFEPIRNANPAIGALAGS